jgi:hypothetical protein
MRKVLFPFLVIVSLLLTGCEQTMVIRFPSAQNFMLRAIIDLDRELFKDAGQLITSPLADEFGVDFPGARFDPALLLQPAMRLYEQSFREMGMNFNWAYKNNKLTYKLSGSSHSQLTGTLPCEFFTITPLGDNTYHLWLDYTFLGEEYMVFTSLVYDTKVTIVAGRIINSNANKQTLTKATWYNPSTIDITFKPGSPIRLGPILIIVIGFTLLIISISHVSKGGRILVCPSCGRKVKSGNTECPNCGTWL